jgi:hypothetical protein
MKGREARACGVMASYACVGKRPKALRFTIRAGEVEVAHAGSGRVIS